MSKERKHVLVVDDSVVIQRLVEARLRDDNFEVTAARTGREAQESASMRSPDVILLDVDLPGDLDGFRTCENLKNDPRTQNIPIIFMNANAKTKDKVRGLDLGAVDYVSKPFDPAELRARVRTAYRLKDLMETLEERAQVDGLTRLYNRAFFDHRLSEDMATVQSNGQELALVMVDVDRFKRINDTWGHSFGDVVLRTIADTLQAAVGPDNLAARYGGEEFVLVLAGQTQAEGGVVAERCRAGIEGLRLEHNGVVVPVTASFGVAAVRGAAESPAELVQRADRGLYAAKQAGRNRVEIVN